MTDEEKTLWELSNEFDALGESEAPQDRARKREIGKIMRDYVGGLEDEYARDMDQYNLIQTAGLILDWCKHNPGEGDPKAPKSGRVFKASKDDDDLPF